MDEHDSNGPNDGNADDRGDLFWNEFDWERYLRQQDEVVVQYLAAYERQPRNPERIDLTARAMEWGPLEWPVEALGAASAPPRPKTDTPPSASREAGRPAPATPEPTSEDPAAARNEETSADADDEEDDDEPYTLHKNPVYIASHAILLSMERAWEHLAAEPARVPPRLALAHYVALHRVHEQATQALAALDFGDFALAIAGFKRSLRELNALMATLHPTAGEAPVHEPVLLAHYRVEAMSRCFDLRELWLRVSRVCRHELANPIDDSEDDDS